jgi:hypothetical protein
VFDAFDPQDVRVMHRGEQPRLVERAVERVRVGDERPFEDLQGYESPVVVFSDDHGRRRPVAGMWSIR